jgi:hypothetical protein
VITGQPAWLKPIKFAISIGVYSLTFVWLLTFVDSWRRTKAVLAWATALLFLGEMAIIAGQVVRGTTSHFNYATPLDGALFSAMGMMIMLLFVAGMGLAVLIVRQRFVDRAFGWSLRFGLILALVGMATGFLMTSPTAEQRAAMAAGHAPATIGAHAVGVADGGPGLPLVGWSTEGGDVRSAHFFGLHGMQALPIVGWLVTLPALAFLSARRRLALVWIAGLGYLGFVLVVLLAALRGQPIVAPDGLTLGLYAGLVAAVAVAMLAIVAPARRTVARPEAPAF